MSKSHRLRFRGLIVAAVVGAAFAFAAPALANPCPNDATDPFILLIGSSFTSGPHTVTVGGTTITLNLTKHLSGSTVTSVDFTVTDNSATETWGVSRAYVNPSGTYEHVYNYSPAVTSATGLVASSTTQPVNSFKACFTSSGVAAARFRSATATQAGRSLTVRWQTASEIDVAGYNVYGYVHGKRVRLNARIIASRSIGANAYTFRYHLPRGMRAPTRLWVQTINLDGSVQWRSVALS